MSSSAGRAAWRRPDFLPALGLLLGRAPSAPCVFGRLARVQVAQVHLVEQGEAPVSAAASLSARLTRLSRSLSAAAIGSGSPRSPSGAEQAFAAAGLPARRPRGSPAADVAAAAAASYRLHSLRLAEVGVLEPSPGGEVGRPGGDISGRDFS